MHIRVSLCNTYNPPSTAHLRDFARLHDQLPKPFVMLGDLNAHNYWWGGSKTDDRGRMFESFVTSNNDMSSSNQSWQATQRAVSSIAVV